MGSYAIPTVQPIRAGRVSNFFPLKLMHAPLSTRRSSWCRKASATTEASRKVSGLESRFHSCCGLIPPDGLCGETTPSWETQFRYDVDYARHVSFALDCRVILATVKILFKRVENNYGAEDRPHLSEYRAQMRKDEHEL